MQFGKTLVGGIVGGAIGVGLLVAVYFLFDVDHAWTAVLVAVCAGLGVRSLVTTKLHPSYARGALTAALAIAAFVGAKFLVVELAMQQTVAVASRPVPAAASPDDESDESGEPSDAEREAALEPEERPLAPVGQVGNPRVQGFSTWDFLWLSVAALIAYELGRGSGTAAPSATTGEVPPAREPPRHE